MARRDEVRIVAREGDDLELQHARPDPHQLLDLPAQSLAVLELALVVDRHGDLAGEEHRARSKILLERGARELELEQREAERDDDEDRQAADDELAANAEPHGSGHGGPRHGPPYPPALVAPSEAGRSSTARCLHDCLDWKYSRAISG